MSLERAIREEELAFIGPVATAQFVDAGWIRLWPMGLTRGGGKAVKNGFGRDKLPFPVELTGSGMHWEGRITRPGEIGGAR